MSEVCDDFSSEMAVYNKWDRNIFPAPPCPSGILIAWLAVEFLSFYYFFLGIVIHLTSNHAE